MSLFHLRPQGMSLVWMVSGICSLDQFPDGFGCIMCDGAVEVQMQPHVACTGLLYTAA